MKQQRKRENAPKIAGSGAFSRMMDSQKQQAREFVAHAQVGDARAFALACLQLDEVGTAVVVDATQFVEFGVVTVGNDAALAQQGRRFRENRRTEQVEGRIGSCELIKELGEQRRSRAEQRCAQFGEAMQAVAQARQVARSGAEQCHATGDAFDVGNRAKCRGHRVEWTIAGVAEQRDAAAHQAAERFDIVDFNTVGGLRVKGGDQLLHLWRIVSRFSAPATARATAPPTRHKEPS